MPLEAGQMSIHNYRLAHASNPNSTDNRLIGISMHFIPPDTQQLVGGWYSATQIRGEDRFCNFEATPIPLRDFDLDAVLFHEKSIQVIRKVIYTDAEINTEKF